MKFYKWYTQAVGSLLGLIACLYAYLRGDMLLYSNINGNYDYLGFDGVLASYLLYPLCFFSFIFALIISSKPEVMSKKFLNVEFSKYNHYLIVITVLVGLLGCKIYFIVPAALILIIIITNENYYAKINDTDIKDISTYNNDYSDTDTLKIINSRKEMAIDLIKSNANIDFINEVTGLSIDDIKKLKNQAKKLE